MLFRLSKVNSCGAMLMKVTTAEGEKKIEAARQPVFSFRRIAGRELYQPAQLVEPDGPRVYFRSRKHVTGWAN